MYCFVKTNENANEFDKFYFNTNLKCHHMISVFGFIPYGKQFEKFSNMIYNKFDLINNYMYSKLPETLKDEYTRVGLKYFKFKPMIFVNDTNLNQLRKSKTFDEYSIITNFDDHNFENVHKYFELICDENYKYGCNNFNYEYNSNDKIMILDTETTNVPIYENGKIPNYTCMKNFENSRLISISWIIADNSYNVSSSFNYLIKDTSIKNSKIAYDINKIDDDYRNQHGETFENVYKSLIKSLNDVKFVVCHGSDFDYNIILFECLKHNLDTNIFNNVYLLNTKQNLIKREKKDEIVGLCDLVNGNKSKAHDALYDCELCLKLFKMRCLEN